MRIALILLILFIAASANSQWQQMPGPYGGDAYGFTSADGSAAIYAQTSSGIYRTYDNGLNKHWSRVGFADSSVQNLLSIRAGSSDVVFVSTSNALYRSLDSGRTWSDVFPPVRKITNIGQNVFALSSTNGALYRSVDAGSNWAMQDIPKINQFLPRTMISGSGYLWVLMSNDTFFRSGTLGSNWEVVSTPPIPDINALVYSGSTLFAGGRGGIVLSTDRGGTWITPLNSGIDTAETVLQIAANGLTIVALEFEHVTASTDGGRSWQSIKGKGALPNATTFDALVQINGTFYCGNRAGIYTSSDGFHWTNASNGENGALIYDILNYNDTLFSATEQGIHRSADHGMTWSTPSGGNDLADSMAFKLQLVDGDLYAMRNGLWKFSSDKWITISDEPVLNVTPVAGMWYAAVGNSGVMSSSDKGLTWLSKSVGLPTDASYTTFVISAYGKLFAVITVGAASNIYQSIDGGSSWTYHASIPGLVESSASSVVGSYLSTQRGLYRSTDQGASWTLDPFFGSTAVMGVSSSFNNGIIVELLQDNQGHKQPGFYYSADGVNWKPEGDKIQNVYSFANDGKYSYAGTEGNGLWRISTASLDVRSPASATQTSITLFPNPAKSNVNIKCPARCEFPALVRVIDETGRQVSAKQVRTSAEMSLDIGDLVAGRYNIVVQSASFTGSARLLIERE